MNMQRMKYGERLEKVLGRIKEETKGRKFVFGFSGGVDSRVLLDVLVRAGVEMVVVHINHKLRKGAEEDERFVVSLAREFGVEVRVVGADVGKFAKNEKRGLEEVGRRVRRKVLEYFCERERADGIILAHQADDQVETVLMNLKRGCGNGGGGGMREWRGRYWRPMLGVRRADILRYAKERGLSWREDESNEDLRFERNFVRKVVILELEKEGEDFKKRVWEYAEGMKRVQEKKEGLARGWLEERGYLPGEEILELGVEEQGEVLRQWWIYLEGAVEGFERERVREVMRLVKRGVGRKKVRFGNWWMVWRDKRLQVERG